MPGLDEERVAAELGKWLREPRTNSEIRERVRGYEGVSDEQWAPIVFARTLLPLVQLPPGGSWGDRGRASFVIDPRPLPDPVDAAAAGAGALSRRPSARRAAATWPPGPAWPSATSPRRWRACRVVTYRDERGTELLDLPGRPLPPESTPLPVRLLGRWDQPLLAYEDRERIIPAEVKPLRLTLSGDQTVTVDGRVAASWQLERQGGAVRVAVTPHVELRRAARAEIRAEAERTARFCVPDARSVDVVGI